TSLGDTLKMKRLAVKTVGLFLITAMIASLIGLTVGSLMDFSTITELTTTEVRERDIPPVATVLTNLIPTNPVAALASGNVLQIIVFAVLVGIAINVVGEKAEPMKKVMEAGAEIMYQITRMVLQLTPIGVLGLMAWVVGSFGLETLLPLGKFILAIYLACFIHILFTYGGMVRLFGGMSPLAFFKAILPAQLVAFSSASSFGTLPVTHKVVTEDLKVSKNYASFVLPLGATINMDGCGGIYPAIAAIFIAHLYGIPLDATSYLLIAITATLASLGTAGVPGSAMVMLTVTLSVVGLPLEGIAFIAAVDRIIDMMRTATNVTGDTMVARVVAHSEGLIEQENEVPAANAASQS
ncbi:MAG: dicarboxylate/amino acid:cation symporter, partial [Alkalimonas sp.]|nr:dicarboxylate/amino acid:cation symporter [Alkalimonas sp.]